MPITATAGQVLVNSMLPPEYRDYTRSLAGSGLDDLLSAVAHRHPEKYKDISKALMQLGADTSYTEGTTISVNDIDLSPEMELVRKSILDHIAEQEKAIQLAPDSPKAKRAALAAIYGEATSTLHGTVFENALTNKNPLALQVLSKARGTPGQLAAMLATPGSFQDAKGETLPIFIRHSFAEGLSPAEYYASTHGARKGVVSTKMATMRAGDFGKQLNVASEGLMVVAQDCGTLNGIPYDVTDNDIQGATLARDTGDYQLGTPIDGKMVKSFKVGNRKQVLVRSPITCQAKGGLCATCVGLREDGKFPKLGTAIGTLAASPLSERIAQGSLNTKHTASAGGSKSGKKGEPDEQEEEVYGGFDIINQLGQVPEAFRHEAPLSSLDGTVQSISAAPQGGTNVVIDGVTHYVGPEQRVLVKPNQELEAGDQLSTGIINPAEVVKYKGIGEGRRYYANRLAQAYADSALKANRRNTEVVARAVIDHVDINSADGVGDYLPGDVASYESVAQNYQPRAGASQMRAAAALGKYLEQPALHYTIGTRVTKSMAKQLKDFQSDDILVNSAEPDFTPRMVRLRVAPHNQPDWLEKLKGSYLESNLLQSAQSGAESNIHGTNPVPAIVYGVELGKSKPGQVTY